VKQFFTPGYSITQCEQANNQLKLTTCCADGSSAGCDVPWYLNFALDGLGNFARMSGSALSFAEVQSQIRVSRPVGCRIGWSGGGAHFVAIDGLDPASPNQLLSIKDPIYGTSVVPYNTFSTSYQGIGSWTTSYLTKP
jgi:hypothetical protein